MWAEPHGGSRKKSEMGWWKDAREGGFEMGCPKFLEGWRYENRDGLDVGVGRRFWMGDKRSEALKPRLHDEGLCCGVLCNFDVTVYKLVKYDLALMQG